MAIIKCKMCGGDLNLIEGSTVAECEYCGTRQTLPSVRDDILRNLFNRANNLRIKCEFDKAEQIYEKILQEDDTEAEAHWGIVLCRYGIEYVEDPKTFQRIPTCHRTSFESVIACAEYQSALAHADAARKRLYEAEAAAIDNIQKNILDVVRNEQPFDVFLCYKQTDEAGKRTVDSAIANDIYHQLTMEGMNVFYAAITLEDKLGQEYEPYIFAALNSARVMLVIGTRPEFFTAVWVKNEWSRFMKLMKTDRTKLLIPCYKDMDAYDLPEEFAHLQAQDMSKIGFINDVVRGIRKVVTKDEPKATPIQETVVTAAPQNNAAPLLKRAAMFLEDGQWENADEYCEKVLDADPENAQAYLIKLLSGNRVSSLGALAAKRLQLTAHASYQRLRACLDDTIAKRVFQTYSIPGYYTSSEILSVYEQFDASYSSAVASRQKQRQDEAEWWEDNYFIGKVRRFADEALSQQLQSTVEQLFATMDARIAEAESEAEKNQQGVLARYTDIERTVSETAVLRQNKREYQYNENAHLTDTASRDALERAISVLSNMGDYKDAPALIVQYKDRIQLIDKLAAEQRRAQAQQEAEKAARKKKKQQKTALIALSAIGIVLVMIFVLVFAVVPASRYKKAEKLLAEGNTMDAMIMFGSAKGYKDAQERSMELWSEVAPYRVIDADDSVLFLRNDGSVLISGDTDNGKSGVSRWRDIVSVSAAGTHVVGLRANGTVEALGYNQNGNGECNVGSWRNIVSVNAGFGLTLGLKSDGTVVARGYNGDGERNVNGWTDIIAIAAGDSHSVGLKKDGTVVATGASDDGQCAVQRWTDITAITAGMSHTVGLKKDGTVVATGWNKYGQCDVANWTDIIAIDANSGHTVGLRADGTVVATGENDDGECNVSEWTDIVAIAANYNSTIGLRSDGTIVSTSVTYDWTDIRIPAHMQDAVENFLIAEEERNNAAYLFAETLLADGKPLEAFRAFRDLGDYRDAAQRCSELMRTLSSSHIVDTGRAHSVALQLDGTVVAVGARDDDRCDVSDWTDIVSIHAENGHTVGLRADGTVVADGYNEYDQCDVDTWTDVYQVAIGPYHTVGIKTDGTVVATGYNENGMCNVGSWSNIVSVVASDYHTVGLRADGTVVAVGTADSNMCAVASWRNITAICAGQYHTVGLKADGTVVATGNNHWGQCDLDDWTNIVAVCAGVGHTVGLKADGTVVAVGLNDYGQLQVSDWTDIVQIFAKNGQTFGLKADGTVVAAGYNENGQCNVSGWKNIVAISADYFYTLGLKADGTVVATGSNQSGQCNVSSWRNIRIPE